MSRPDSSDQQPQETVGQRRARLASVFGEVLPDTTRDERDPDSSDVRRERDPDEWLRGQVPPHHGS